MVFFGLFSLVALFSFTLAAPVLSNAGASQYTTCETCTGANNNLLITYCWNPDTETCSSVLLLPCSSPTTQHTYNCPVAPPSAFPYTDDFGRNKALPFLAANYGNNTQQAQACLDSHADTLPGVTVLAQIESSNCSSIVALNPQDQVIVVSFRGAVGLEQFLLLGINLFVGPQYSFASGGTVYAYYYNCFFSLWNNGLGAQIQAAKTANPSYGLWSFGHSLGATLASLTSAYSVSTDLFTSDEVKEITTGQTRSGNLEFAQGHDNLVPNAYRIVNQGDWITKLPLKLVLDDSGSFHHRHEVWYQTSMAVGSNFTVYDQAEDPNGSDSQGVNLSDESHNVYFNVPLNTWVNTNCQ